MTGDAISGEADIKDSTAEIISVGGEEDPVG